MSHKRLTAVKGVSHAFVHTGRSHLIDPIWFDPYIKITTNMWKILLTIIVFAIDSPGCWGGSDNEYVHNVYGAVVCEFFKTSIGRCNFTFQEHSAMVICYTLQRRTVEMHKVNIITLINPMFGLFSKFMVGTDVILSPVAVLRQNKINLHFFLSIRSSSMPHVLWIQKHPYYCSIKNSQRK